MIYLAGDNNLSTAGDTDIEEMRTVGSSDDVNIVAEFDNAGDLGTKRYHIQKDGVGEDVESLGETDAGDPKVLLDFIKWAKENYPANRYALVLWNHGNGWEPLEIERIASSVDAIDFSIREIGARAPLRKVFFRTTLEKIYGLDLSIRAICTDDGTGHSLDTIELGNVLTKTKDILDQEIDLLGMDACLMSNLEVAYQAKPFVNYIVASEENEPNDGWPYHAVVRELVNNPDLPTSELTKKIVTEYVKSYVDRGYTGPVTQSALDLSKIEEVTEPLDKLSSELSSEMATAKYEIGNAQADTPANFYYGTLWDIANVSRELETKTTSTEIKEVASLVYKALHPSNKEFVIAEAHNGAKVEGCGGVSIYLPPRSYRRLSQYYCDLEFAKEHQWYDMLKNYHQ